MNGYSMSKNNSSFWKDQFKFFTPNVQILFFSFMQF